MADDDTPLEDVFMTSDTTVRYVRNAIIINDVRFLPAEIIQIAARWTEHARNHGWRLYTPEGHQIDFDEFTRRLGRQIADLEDATDG